jgi:hypothetical protein
MASDPFLYTFYFDSEWLQPRMQGLVGDVAKKG